MRIFTRKWWLPTGVASICAIAAVAGSTWQPGDLPQSEPQPATESPASESANSENTPQQAAPEPTHADAIPAGGKGLLYDLNRDGVLDYIPEVDSRGGGFYISDETGYNIIACDWYDTIGHTYIPRSIHRINENIYVACLGSLQYYSSGAALVTFSMHDLKVIDYINFYDDRKLTSCDYNNDGRTDFLYAYDDINDVYSVCDDGNILRNKLSAVDIKDLLPQDDSGSQTGGCGFITMDFSMLSAGYLYSQMFAGGSTQSGSAIGENTFRATDINGDGLTDMVNFQSGKIFYNLGEGGRYCIDTFNGSMFFADFNGDGLDDYVLYSDNKISTNLVKADGTVMSKNVISGFTCANIWCRDVDRDGDPDLVLSLEGSQNFMVILENDGKGSFRRREYAIASDLKDFKYCIDYDNDGNYEILSTTKALKINGTKIDVNPIDLMELSAFPTKYSVKDIFVNPIDGKVYLIPIIPSSDRGANMLDYSISTKANTAPIAPSEAPEFVYEASTGLLKITWKHGADTETPVNDLTYALRIGSTPGAEDIMSADAVANGTRLSATEGNNGTRLQRIMDTSSWPEGTYHIAVQSVDGNYMGSPFSKEAVFEKKEPQCAFSMHYTDVFAINDILTLKTTTPKNPDLIYNWSLDGGVITGENPDKGEVYVTFAEPGTKAITLQITGANGNSSRSFSREITVSGVPLHNSLKVTCATIENEEPHFMAALDIDEDGQMDPYYRKVVTGYPSKTVYGFMSGDRDGNYALIPKMFNNNNLISTLGDGIGTFDINGDGLCDYVATDADSWRRKILATNLGELDMDFQQVTTDLDFSYWVDFDNDGKYDGAALPRDYHRYYYPIYRNDGDYQSFKSKQLQTYAVLYDFNNDGLLDVIGDDDYEWIAGEVCYKHWIYLNNGDFTCTKYKELGEPYGHNSSRNLILHVDDFDNNGKYDFLYYTGKKTILQWDDGTSTELPIVIKDAQDFSVFDYDNNGYPDIYGHYGYFHGDESVIAFYQGRQFTYNTFEKDEYETEYSFLSRAPFRLPDGKIGTAGFDGLGVYPSTQIVNVANEAPEAPTAVRHSQNERFVVIEWDHSTDKETPATQMRYNLSVKHKGMEGEGAYVFSPANSGKNGVPVPTHKPLIRGNRFSIPIANIPAGEYEVKVQGVDLMRDCSDFSETYMMTVTESALIDMQPSGEVDVPVLVKALVNTDINIDFDGGRQTSYASGEYTVVWDTPGIKTVTVNGTKSKIHIQPAPDGSFTAPAVIREGDRIILKGKLMNQGSWYVKRYSDGGKATYTNFFDPNFSSGSLTQIDETTAEMVLNSRYAYNNAEIVHTVYSEFSEREYAQPVSRAYNPSTEATPQLRYVTADGTSGKYKLQWTLPNEIREEATGVNVYRETSVSGKYELMASMPLTATEYIDMASTPDIVASRYVISYVLTYGESAYSRAHQPVHVMINRGAGSSWNLIWGKYEGGTIPQYRILRGSSPESLEVIATVSGNMTSYTDFTAPTSGALYYAVETELDPSATYGAPSASRATTRAPRSNVVAAAGGNITFVESLTVISADGNTTLSADEASAQSIKLMALINPTSATFGKVNWIVISGEDLVTVDQLGTVRATGTDNGTATVRAMTVDGSGKYADININVSGYSGIDAPRYDADSEKLTAWPSPATTEVTIGGLPADDNELYIFSLGSQIMHHQKTNGNNVTVQCEYWTPGVYIAKSGSRTVKFLKR